MPGNTLIPGKSSTLPHLQAPVPRLVNDAEKVVFVLLGVVVGEALIGRLDASWGVVVGGMMGLLNWLDGLDGMRGNDWLHVGRPED